MSKLCIRKSSDGALLLLSLFLMHRLTQMSSMVPILLLLPPFAIIKYLVHSQLSLFFMIDYVIPSGTMVVQNTWSALFFVSTFSISKRVVCMLTRICSNRAIAYDETAYPGPDQYKPERFLVKDPPMDPRYYAFGVGRRHVLSLVFWFGHLFILLTDSHVEWRTGF